MTRARRAVATVLTACATTLATGACGTRPTESSVLELDTGDCPPGTNIIEGTAGDDTIVGTAGADCILGYAGDDNIDGANGDDFLVGGEGQDVLVGGNGADQIFGDDGDDTIAGGNGPDTIDGGAGNDIISGNNGPDLVIGGDGNDVILDSRGPATISPGPGTDSCGAPDCERPTATSCVTTSECSPGQRCVGGACVYCHADAECDDGMLCTGRESCVPVVGCQDGADELAGVPVGTSCEVGIGACRRTGESVCDGSGGVVCNTPPGLPHVDDDCDGIDDDCDGSADDEFHPLDIECGAGPCRRTGRTECTAEGEVPVCVPGTPVPETCNGDGVDNDCNGLIDDGDLPDTDGDTLCDGPRVARPTAGPGEVPDACPFHPDLTVVPGFDLVLGEMFVQYPGDPSPRPVPNLQVRTGLGDSITDCTGTYAYLVPAGSASINADDMVLQFWFHAALRGPEGTSSIVQVVDDLGIPWGLGSLHGFLATDGGFSRTIPSHVEPPDARGRRIRRVDRVVLRSSEAELYRVAVMIADDYQAVHRSPVPGGTLSFMREAGVLGALTYVDYNFVRVSAEALGSGVLETQPGREQTLFHESAHVFRHVMDGDSAHFLEDVFRFSLARCHTGREIAAEGYAFNEGWADYWSAARYDRAAGSNALFNVPSPDPDARNPIVVTIDDITLRGAAPPETTTDYCDTGVIGGRGIGLTEAHLDFVEFMVRDRLLDISRTCLPGAPLDEADAVMLRVLQSSPGSIHSIFEFEETLSMLGMCTGTPDSGPLRSEPPPECPPDYNDDGEHCSRDGHVIRERSG